LKDILIIYNQVPTNIYFYHVQVVAGSQEHVNLLACNDKYVSGDTWDLEEWFLNYIENLKTVKPPFHFSGEVIETGILL
jgi:hypothetical protein